MDKNSVLKELYGDYIDEYDENTCKNEDEIYEKMKIIFLSMKIKKENYQCGNVYCINALNKYNLKICDNVNYTKESLIKEIFTNTILYVSPMYKFRVETVKEQIGGYGALKHFLYKDKMANFMLDILNKEYEIKKSDFLYKLLFYENMNLQIGLDFDDITTIIQDCPNNLNYDNSKSSSNSPPPS